jgi:hypothetical protein
MLEATLVVVLILALIGTVPVWPHSAKWGFLPSGGLGVGLLAAIILTFAGVI